jgi:hypothetical protein
MAAKKTLPRRQADKKSGDCCALSRQNLATTLGEPKTNEIENLHMLLFHN